MGDVVTALGRAVQEEGHRVEVILPKFDCINYKEVGTWADARPLCDTSSTDFFLSESLACGSMAANSSVQEHSLARRGGLRPGDRPQCILFAFPACSPSLSGIT